MNFQFKFGLLRRSNATKYDPVTRKFSGFFSRFLNRHMDFYESINYTIVWSDGPGFGECDSFNCTSLLGMAQRGEVDLIEKNYAFATISSSIVGLKPGPVLIDSTCYINSALPESATAHDDVLKSLSIFSLDVVLILTFCLLFLFSIPFLLWYFKLKFRVNSTNSPPIFWPVISALLQQQPSTMALFQRHTLRFVWLSIAFTLLSITSIYSGSFTTDLSSRVNPEKIDTLADVATCGRIPLWMETAACRAMLNDGTPEVEGEIIKRGRFVTLGDFISILLNETRDIERFVFISTAVEFESARLAYCSAISAGFDHEWHVSPESFPSHLFFTPLNAKLSPEATKLIFQIQMIQFESGISRFYRLQWNWYIARLFDPQRKLNCATKTFIKVIPALYRFEKLDVDNYKIFFECFFCIVPFGILSLIVEHLCGWLTSTNRNKCVNSKL